MLRRQLVNPPASTESPAICGAFFLIRPRRVWPPDLVLRICAFGISEVPPRPSGFPSQKSPAPRPTHDSLKALTERAIRR